MRNHLQVDFIRFTNVTTTLRRFRNNTLLNDMQIDLTKIATALITTLVVGVMTYQLTTIRQIEIDNELIKIRLEYVEKKLKKRGKKQ